MRNDSSYTREYKLRWRDPDCSPGTLEDRIDRLSDALIKEQARVDQLMAAVSSLPGVCEAMGHLYELPDSQVRERITAGLLWAPRECSRCGNPDGGWYPHHWTLPDGKLV